MKVEIYHEGQRVGTIACASDTDEYELSGDTTTLRRVLARLMAPTPSGPAPKADAAFLATLPRLLHGWYWYAKIAEK